MDHQAPRSYVYTFLDMVLIKKYVSQLAFFNKEHVQKNVKVSLFSIMTDEEKWPIVDHQKT